VLTAVVDRTQAQLGAGRAGLVTSATDVPSLYPGPTGQFVGLYAVYQQTRNQVFVEAMDTLFIITAVITVVGVALALLLRSGPVPQAKGGAAHVDVG